jgi:biopolymer transport protein ExbB
MMGFLLQAENDTITQATGAVIENIGKENEISVLEFIFKGGFFLIPIALLLFYTIYIIIERYIYIKKATKHDPHLLKDIRTHLNSGNIALAISAAERDGAASANVIKEGIQTIGRPIAEIESNMEKVANIEIGEMEKKLAILGLVAGIAPTLGFIGTISGVIKIFYSISVTENISIGNISGGLYEKMISSGAGLIVGIVAYSGYHLYNSMIDNYSLNMQRHVLEFVNIIQRPNADKTK